MSVSTTTFGHKVWAAPPTDFPQFRGADRRDMYFEEDNFFSPEKTTAQIKARTFFEHLEERSDSQKQAQPPLQALLSRTLHIVPCISGLVSGTFGSSITQHPLPLLIGLSQCFPQASAQQKVGGEFQVHNNTKNNQYNPSVASFDDGNFVVACTNFGYGIFGQLFNETGSKIGSEFQANTYTPFNHGDPSVASLKNENFVIIWTSFQQDGSFGGIYGQIFNRLGSKIGSEFQVNTYTSQGQEEPCVIRLSNDSFVVTWQSYSQEGPNFGIFGQLYDETGNKNGNEFHINTFTDQTQILPSATNLNNGNFVVVWESWYQDGSQRGIYGQLFNENGGNIGSEFRANTYTTNDQGSPAVTSFPNGNFVVIWESSQQDGSSWGVFGQFFNKTGTKIGNEFQANTYTTNHQMDPVITSFPNGNFVVIWTGEGQGDNFGVFGQLFDGNGTKSGGEFQVNTYTNNTQWFPAVTSMSNGNFVVTWQSEEQNGNTTGIYGQIFHDNITYPPTSTTTSSTTSSTTLSSTTTTTSSSSMTTSSSTTSTSSSSITSTKSSSTVSTSKSTSFHSSVETSGLVSSPSPPSKKRLLWLWLLLGIGGAFCLGGISYLLKKLKDRDDDDLATELKKQTDTKTAESPYHLTPDCVHPGSEQERTEYGCTPDCVHPGSEQERTEYGCTPDCVHPGSEQEGTEYGFTPDHVT